MGLDGAASHIVYKALSVSQSTSIVDLCSGAGGLLIDVQENLSRQWDYDVTVTLTDKYPNTSVITTLPPHRQSTITYLDTPVDATQVPPTMVGLRTLFTAFHHFKPHTAKQILRDACKSQSPIAVVEITRRTPTGILQMLLSPVAVWVVTPFVRPFSLRRWLLTYLLPIIPLCVTFDAVVSAFRSYTCDELERMAAAATDAPYKWETAQRQAPFGYKLTYLIGIPEPTDKCDDMKMATTSQTASLTD